MESTLSTSPAQAAVIPEKSAARDLALLLLACAALWGWTYGLWDFTGPDEPRYVQIARELLGRANWFILTIMGEPYDQKPPLPYWMMAAVLQLNGGEVSSWVVRFPSLFFGVLTVLMTYLIGRARLGRRAGWLGAWILLTSVLFLEEVPAARLDILLTGWVALAMWAWLGRADDSRPLPPARAALFWVALTGAFFIKGPVAWVLVLGAAALESWRAAAPAPRLRLDRFWWLLVIGGGLVNLGAFVEKIGWISLVGWLLIAVAVILVVPRPGLFAGFRRLRPAFGLPFAILVVVAWQAVLRLTAPPDNFQNQLQTATLERLVNPSMHVEWPGYYLEGLFTSTFPVWSVLLALALWGLWRSRRTPSPEWPALRPLLSWLLWSLILLTIIPTKREQYLLPVYPAMALITGWWLARRDDHPVPSWLPKIAGYLAMLAGAAVILSALVTVTFGGKFSDEFAKSIGQIKSAPLFGLRIAGLVLAGSLLIFSRLAWVKISRVSQAAGLFIATTLSFAVVAMSCGAPLMNTLKSTRPINAAIAAQLKTPDETVGAIGTAYKAQNMVYSAHRLVELKNSATELAKQGASLPRVIIGEADEKKWKKIEEALGGLGYKPVFRAPASLDYLTVLVREK